eukprot:scaffold2858_cov659-Pavlova_lutheri.AAC.191
MDRRTFGEKPGRVSDGSTKGRHVPPRSLGLTGVILGKERASASDGKRKPLVANPFGWGRGGTARHRGVPGLGFGASQTLPRPSSLPACPRAHPTSRRGDLRRSLSFLHAIRPYLRPVWGPSPPLAPPFHRVLQRRA